MLFNSLSYAVFLPVVFVLYWAIPHRFRWCLLLVSSYYFYMSWNPKYVVLIFGTTLISYLAAILMERSASKQQKKSIIAGTALVCLGILFVFKYFNFTIESACKVMGFVGLKLNPYTLKLLLPVGISFYTFQTLSYVIDVYRGDVKAEHHFGYYATFISFFPQLVAGPIERTSNLLPQIKEEHFFEEQTAISGLRQMLWGYFKKIAVADSMAVYVNTVYKDLLHLTGFPMVLAVFFFTIQIYCDFSGYSDIAIGTAKLLGINLMRNFNCPYYSTSIKEFWKRWHISLSTWFRDYVYIPLGGNRCSKWKQRLNLMITFLVSGLWHGANWTYVIWGGLHGIAQIVEDLFSKQIMTLKRSKAGIFISWAIVFCFCNVAWVFFRAPSIQDAIYVLSHMFVGILNPISYLKSGFTAIGISKNALAKIVVSLLVLAGGDFIYIYTYGRIQSQIKATNHPVDRLCSVYLVNLGASSCLR